MDGHDGLVRILVLASFGFIHCFLLTSESNKEIKILVLYFTKKEKKKAISNVQIQ